MPPESEAAVPRRREAARQDAARILAAVVGIGVAVAVARALGYKVYGHVVVRCRRGHEFTTFWVPGVKLRSLDLVVARVQHCPVGPHWSLVTPVRHAAAQERS